MKKHRLRIHKQTLNMMNNPEYIYIWINPNDKAIAICSCEQSNKDALKIPTKRECELYSTGLFEELKCLNVGLLDGCTYRLTGSVSQGKKVARFNIIENISIDQSNTRLELYE